MIKYLNEIQKYYSDTNSSEISYRTPFENLLKEIFPSDQGYFTQHDQKAINGNKPDFVVLKNGVPLLYIEVKKVGEDLNKIEKSGQAERYFGYDNLIISDYVNFRFYRNGQKYNEEISLGEIDKKNLRINSHIENADNLIKTILDFTHSHKEPIKSGNHLAKIMGAKARRIRDNVLEMLTKNSESYEELFKIRDVVKQNLLTSIDDEKFADMYAQTLVYGLFAARYGDKTLDSFSRAEARELVPKTNPFLANFFDHISGANFPNRLKYIVDELCEVFTHANVYDLMHDYYKKYTLFGKEEQTPDPVIHFYEDFLHEYDIKKKMEMGVFYTPRPVVQFIVRAVDDILKSDFNISKGLADNSKISQKEKIIDTKSKSGRMVGVDKEFHRVQVLDVATGTGTFLNEVLLHVYKSFEGQEGRWKSYVESDLLPRLHGFELMMASYTIAHLKLGMTLTDTGAAGINKRLGVYLTNTLDEAHDYSNQGTLFGFMDSIAEESKSASRIKSEYPIMCVIGNPPYSGISQNKNYTGNNVYKVEIGGKEKLKEKKNWLDDDYVKFIRFGESLIEKNEEGILAMITAHGYIDNPTFRGMRWHLRNTFDKIYVLDLHGNSRKKEVAKDGSKDENVFDIMSGVSIIIGLKHKDNIQNKDLAKVFIHDIYGTRKSKFNILDDLNMNNIDWLELPASCDAWKVEGTGRVAYEAGISLANLFVKNNTGIVTGHDSDSIFINTFELNDKTQKILNSTNPKEEFGIKDGRRKKVAERIAELRSVSANNPTTISYRPFDNRFMYYTTGSEVWINSPRPDIMKNFMNTNNIGLVFVQRSPAENQPSYIFVSNHIVINGFIRSDSVSIDTVAPLYLHNDNNKNPNLDKKIWDEINEIVGDTSPENVLDYVYGYLHDKNYREKYNEFLKIDFPRVPYPKDKVEFDKYVEFGNKLRLLHLMDTKALQEVSTKVTYPEVGSDEVEDKYPKRMGDKVYINEGQYFGNVSDEAWEYYIGGYQPAQKYLKDRKGRKLSNDEIENYINIVKVLWESYKLITNF